MRKDLISILLLFALSFIFHSRLFLSGELYTSQDLGGSDITHLNYPIKDLYAKSIKSFKLPLWTDQIFTGYPILAEGQMGAFFLPNIILFYLFPTYLAFNLSYLLTFFLASLGVYLYCRQNSLKQVPSLFAAITFTFSFVFVGHVIHLNLLQAVSLAPWLFYLTDLLFKKPKSLLILPLAFLFSQQIFAGYLQIFVYTSLFLLIYAAIRCFKEKAALKKLSLLFLSICLGIAFSAIQLLPTFELYNLSIREQYSLKHLLLYPFELKDLANFINPYFWGDPSMASYNFDREKGLFWENNPYVGILPLIFALFALVKIRGKITLAYGLLVIFTLTLSLAFLPFIFSIPPFSTFRLPQRSLFITVFAISILAAVGLSSILESLKKSRREILGFLLVSLAYLNLFLTGSGLPACLSADTAGQAGYNGGLNTQEWLKIPETAKFLINQQDGGRIYTVFDSTNWSDVYRNISKGWRNQDQSAKLLSTRAALNSNSNILYQVPHVMGYTPLQLKSTTLINTLVSRGITQDETGPSITSSSLKILGIQNAKYIVSPVPLKLDSGLKKVFEQNDQETKSNYIIYQNQYAVGRIYPIKQLFANPSMEVLLNSLNDASFNPHEDALMLGQPLNLTFNPNVKIKIINQKSDFIEFETSSEQEAFVVISDTYYPGWKLAIDGILQKNIARVNLNFKGILLPPGSHKVALFYQPESFRIGAFISLLSLLGALIYFYRPDQVFKNKLQLRT